MAGKSKFAPILLGCGGLLVVTIASCAGLAFYMYKNADATISPRIDTILAAMQRDDFGDTYLTETTPELRQVASLEQYEQLGARVRTRLGALKSKSMTNVSMRQLNANTYTDVGYTAVFEKGTGSIVARLQKIDGNWLFTSLNINSPQFEKDFATTNCPKCSEPIRPVAKFCPACGAALVTAEKPEAETSESPPETQ